MQTLNLIILAIAYLLSLVSHATAGGFYQQCTDVSVDSWQFMLYARCQKTNLSNGWKELGLGACLWNDDGTLRWAANGAAHASCFKCILVRGSIVGCQCRMKDPKKLKHYTEIDINEHVKVERYKLRCDWDN